MPLPLNIRLGRFEIRSQIGAGGMGEVYLAYDSHLDRHIALKVLPTDLINDHAQLRRFAKEARAASALNHQNIITIHEIGVDGATHYIATEYIEGETLRQRLRAARFELEETLEIATQIAAALDAAHRGGIVHRDIKPENIMLREDGLVKVLDFGLAKLTEDTDAASADTRAPTRMLVKTNPGVVMGTVAYMSPEQARGLAVDARTDIFSLGVVLYEMLTGKLPFAGETASDVIAAILKTEPAPLSNFNQAISGELDRIVSKTLAKKREERYQTAKDLLIDLRQLKKHLEIQSELERTATAHQPENENTTQILTTRSTSRADYIISKINRKRGVTVVLSVLLLAAIGFGYWFVVRRSSNSKQIESIAVLPFINESGDPGLEYLSDGMTESLINSLSQLPSLSVKARSTVFRFKGKDVYPEAVGSDLGVGAVVTGRVVQRGDSLTVSAEMVDVSDGKQLWGERYERKVSELLGVQREIARDISSNLREKLSGADERRVAKCYTESTEAYQLYLRGLFFANKGDGMDKRIEYFRQALTIDPSFALAYAGLADAYIETSIWGDSPPREAMPKAREAAVQALSLDGDLAEARTSLGFVLRAYDFDFAGSEREIRRAIELNPNYGPAHQRYSDLLTTLGRHEEAVAEARRALEIDPLSLAASTTLCGTLIYAGRYDEAVAQLNKALELEPDSSVTRYYLYWVYRMKGNHAESVEEWAKYLELSGDAKAAAAAREGFARGGWTEFLRVMTGERRPPGIHPYDVATFFAALGEKDKAFAELNRAYEKRDNFLVYLKIEPLFDALREDPRFQELLRRVGF